MGTSGFLGRRRILSSLGGALAGVGLARSVRADQGAAQPAREDERSRRAVARQEIMEVRHAYAVATDLIGSNREPALQQGRAIYRRIFTAQAHIGAMEITPVVGPDAWVDVVKDALVSYSSTQHLIGTQHVSELRLPGDDGLGGAARMTSYLQAWHSTAGGDLWLFIGTYEDDLVWSALHGWQIASMMLHRVAEDFRRLGTQPSGGA